MSKEAMKLALEALETSMYPQQKQLQAITALREALANEALDKMAENARELGLNYEPAQPQVRTGNCLRVGVCASEGHKIQAQRTWVGLTDEDDIDWEEGGNLRDLVKAIEAKLKEKNNG
jgi:hypothetical protein